MKKHPIKTRPMWNPNEPTYADVGDVVGKAFAAGLRPDPVEEPVPADLPPNSSKPWCATPCANTSIS